MSEAVGRVLGTQDAMPLDFWVGVAEGQYVQLDDVVVVATPLPDGRVIRLFGVVDVVRARHEGARFDSDVFLIEEGVLPASVAQAAHVRVTRVEPEVFVPALNRTEKSNVSEPARRGSTSGSAELGVCSRRQPSRQTSAAVAPVRRSREDSRCAVRSPLE